MSHNLKSSAFFRRSLMAVLLAVSSPLLPQHSASWQPADLESLEYGKTLASASTVGHYSYGKQSGRSQFVVSCRQSRVACSDCNASGWSIKEFGFVWTLPAISDFNFGWQNDLDTLGIDPNPQTPRDLDESVMSNGRWKISFKSKPEDISALKGYAGKRATLVLHGLPGSGAVTIRTTIPPRGTVFQAVLNACSDASLRFVGGFTTCPPTAGHELVAIKMCSGVSLCEPESTKKGAVWRLPRANDKEPGKERFYRLVCEYKKTDSENDTGRSITEINLSHKLTECDETFKPLSVSCK